MNEDRVERIEQKLLHQKSELQELAQSLKQTGKPVILDQSSVGRLSRMDAIQGQQMALETARRQQHQLLKIEAALKRLESGEYGYCFICGQEIDARRLDADATITRCMECVEK